MNIKMVFIEGGTFNFKNVLPLQVSDFHIGRYPVTQAQWSEVMGTNPSKFENCDDCPVESVSWLEVQDFISKLNSLTGKTYRLPTEAEWEYAARGGNQSNDYLYSGSNNIDAVGWYYKNSGSRTHPVGKKDPNELGLYDMSGNVWEWCWDWLGDYPENSEKDYAGPSKGSYRVLRGGSWYSFPLSCRVAYRFSVAPGVRRSDLGFRLAM